jgi:hypothetical protein
MPSFESPVTNRKFSGQPMKNIEIPDETQLPNQPSNQPPLHRRYANPEVAQELSNFQKLDEQTDEDNVSKVEREIKQAREDKAKGSSRLSDGAKKRLDILIGITRGTRTVDIEGNVFSFKTLKGREMQAVMSEVSVHDGTINFPFEMRRQLLARTLTQIAGVDADQFVGSNSLEDRLTFIDNADDILLNRLYDEYLLMVKETRERYSIKTQPEAQQVVEDLKK